MPEEHKTVFISYRRNVASFIARAIFLDLRMHGYDVFMDVESMDSGEFDTVILNQIEARAHFIIILTPGTLDRCAEKGDLLRREIEHALDEKRNIVPLFVGDFTFKENKKYLTGKLNRLSTHNGLTVPHEYFDEAMTRLRDRFLKKPVYAATPAPPPDEQAAAQEKIEEAAAEPAPTEAELGAEICFLRALVKEEADDLESAIADYTRAIDLNPNFVEAYNNRGILHNEKGDYDDAIADFNEAIRLNPQYDTAYNNRGIALNNKGDYDGAIADQTETIRLDPQFDKAYNNRGIARYNKGDYDGAIADYNESLRLDPKDAETYSNRGIARNNKGDYDGAMGDQNEALRLNPKFVGAYIGRGVTQYDKGNFTASMNDFNAAIRLNPQTSNAYMCRGVVNFTIGNFERALKDYQQANSLLPADNMTLGGLAITHKALGQKADAKRIWRSLLAQDERYKDAEWVGKELNWRNPLLVEAARKLIAEL